MDKSYVYNNAQMLCLLDDFQYESNKEKYAKSIPYDTWRKLKKCQKVSIRVVGSLCSIRDKDNNRLYTDKIYDNGFGRFFYDTVIKKEREKDMGSLYATNTCGETFKVSDNAQIDWGYAEKASTATVSNINANTTNRTNYDSDNSIYTIDTNTNWWNGILQDSLNTTATSAYATKDELEKIQKTFNEYIKNNNKENEKMKGFNFDFGPCNSSSVHMSMYGIAIKNKAGEWVSYNATSGEIINVDIFNIDNMTKFIYKMPVASNAVEVGDVIIHNGYPMFVQAIGEEFKSFDVVDVYAGESKTVIPTKNMFGFDVMTKVVSLFDATAMAPTADQPFGNMLPFLMMGDGKIDPMAMMLLMNQNSNANPFGNPMMMYFMMKDNKDIDPMMMMLMMNQSQTHTCQCGKH